MSKGIAARSGLVQLLYFVFAFRQRILTSRFSGSLSVSMFAPGDVRDADDSHGRASYYITSLGGRGTASCTGPSSLFLAHDRGRR